MNLLKTILISTLISIVILASGVFYFLNFLTFDQMGLLTFNHSKNIGNVTLTNLQSSDTMSDFPTLYNANNLILNNGKIDTTSSSIAAINTLLNLSAVGTITTGTWNATAISVSKGGTGTTSPTQYMVILGNGASGLTIASSTGTAGMSLVSNGAGAYPSWQSISFDLAAGYALTGRWNFTNGLMASSSPYNLLASTTAYTINAGGLFATSSITTKDLTITGTCTNCTNGGYEGVRAYRSSATTSDAVYRRIYWDAETFDLLNEYSSTTGLFTAASTGVYVVEAYTELGGNAAQVRSLEIWKNERGYSTTTKTLDTGAGDKTLNIRDQVSLTAGDTVSIWINSDNNNSFVVGEGRMWVNIYKR